MSFCCSFMKQFCYHMEVRNILHELIWILEHETFFKNLQMGTLQMIYHKYKEYRKTIVQL